MLQRSGRQAAPNKSRGFTIIEVMIVLAIAGLIMLIFFVVVPSAKQKARDYDRKYTSTLLLSQVNQFRADYDHYPSSAERCLFMHHYLGEQISPSATCTYDASKDCMYVQGYKYNFCFHTTAWSSHAYPFDTSDVNPDEISLQVGHWCNLYPAVTNQLGDPIASAGNSEDLRFIVVWVPMERARLFCIDNR